MNLTLALVEILLSPYPESSQSTQSILDSRSECLAPLALNTEKGDSRKSSPVNLPAGGRGAVPSESQKFAGERADSPLPLLRTAMTSPAIQIDRHGDDRFTDNILRACRNLAQNGDKEEEEAAAEEGALIEASGYPDPKFESNGRY